MPDAKTHDLIGFVTGAALVPLAFQLLQNRGESPEQAVAGAALLGAAHMIGSWWLSPDLDIDSAIDNRWGPFFWIWRPYMWLVPHRHRIFSHSGFSGIFRLIYLYVVIILLLMGTTIIASWLGYAPAESYAGMFREWVKDLLRTHPREATLIAIGAITSDAVHTIADHLVTNGQRFLRSVGIRTRRSYRGHR